MGPVRNDKKRRNAGLTDPNRKAEIMVISGLNTEQAEYSSTGWMGLNKRRTDEGQLLVEQWHSRSEDLMNQLRQFQRVEYRE